MLEIRRDFKIYTFVPLILFPYWQKGDNKCQFILALGDTFQKAGESSLERSGVVSKEAQMGQYCYLPTYVVPIIHLINKLYLGI